MPFFKEKDFFFLDICYLHIGLLGYKLSFWFLYSTWVHRFSRAWDSFNIATKI